MTGKEKCKLLRQIRKEIAETNGIVYITSECTYEGDDCRGTCSKCDEEIAYLDAELNRKIADGELITLSGLSLDTFQVGISNASSSHSSSGEIVNREDDIPVMGRLQEIPPSRNLYLGLTIEELDFSVRTHNVLERAGILTVEDMISKNAEDYLCLRNMSRNGLKEVEDKLASMGLSIRDREDRVGY